MNEQINTEPKEGREGGKEERGRAKGGKRQGRRREGELKAQLNLTKIKSLVNNSVLLVKPRLLA